MSFRPLAERERPKALRELAVFVGRAASRVHRRKSYRSFVIKTIMSVLHDFHVRNPLPCALNQPWDERADGSPQDAPPPASGAHAHKLGRLVDEPVFGGAEEVQNEHFEQPVGAHPASLCPSGATCVAQRPRPAPRR